MKLTFRQSEFKGFRRCRRNWALHYRRQLERRKYRPSTSGAGTLVHKGLEALYSGQDWRDALNTLHSEDLARVEPGYEETLVKHLQLSVLILQGYEEWLSETGADVGTETVSVERQLEVPFGTFEGHEVWVTGKVDRELLDQYGHPVLMDFKTRDSMTLSEADRKASQLKTYSVLRMMEDQTLYSAAVYRILRRVKRTARAKPPFYGDADLHFTLDELRKHYLLMQAQLREMVPLAVRVAEGMDLDDPQLYPNPHSDCGWDCPFLEVCPMMDDGSGWDWYLNEFFTSPDTIEIGTR